MDLPAYLMMPIVLYPSIVDSGAGVYVGRIRDLLGPMSLTEAQLNHKIDTQLQTEGGIDALSFDGLQKVITWLESKKLQIIPPCGRTRAAA